MNNTVYIFDLCISQSCKYYLFWLSSLKFKSWMDSNMFLSILCYLLTSYYRHFLAKGNPPVHLCTSQQNMLSSFTALCLFQTEKKNLPKLQYTKMNVTSKGQLISKCLFGAIVSRISALAYKKRLNQKRIDTLLIF